MKKILCLVLATISIFSLILPVFAADGEQGSQINTTFDISKSTISEDFQKVFGGDFDVDDYPYNPLDVKEDNIYLITCVENKVHSKSKSEMYFYIYNPTKKKLALDSEKNQVRGWYSRLEDERSFGDYELEFVCSEADGVLMKFKADGFFTSGAYRQDQRTYFISGIEFVNDGETTAKEYTVAQKYIFRDNENGFVMQSCEDIDTVQTEVKHTYVRYHNPDDYNEAFDLQSVYFNISNDIIDQYGWLDRITAEWEECDMYPVFVTNNEELAEAMKKYINKTSSEITDVQFCWSQNAALTGILPGIMTGCDYGYNYVENTCFLHFCKEEKHIGSSIYEEVGWGDGEFVYIPAEKMTEIQNELGWDDVNFEYIDKSNYGDNKKSFSVFSTNVSNAFLLPEVALSLSANVLFRGMLDNEYIEHPELFSPLKAVDPADVGLSDKAFSVKYLVHEDDVADVKAMISENETTYILNYTITDYFAYNDVYFCEEPELEKDEYECIIADMTAIRSFDLIEGDFVKNGVHTILPFDVDPTNFVPGFTGKSSKDINFGLPTWLIILIVCVVTLIVLKIYKSYKKSSRARKFEKRYLK